MSPWPVERLRNLSRFPDIFVGKSRNEKGESITNDKLVAALRKRENRSWTRRGCKNPQ